jgi:hypothetical protein
MSETRSSGGQASASFGTISTKSAVAESFSEEERENRFAGGSWYAIIAIAEISRAKGGIKRHE